MKNKITISIFFAITFIILLLNIKLYRSYVQQASLLRDINLGTKEFNDNYQEIEVDFPNISVTSMNLKTVKAKYLIDDAKFEEAIELLETVDYDPLGIADVRKAEAYFSLGKYDSMYYASKRAWESLPQNQNHLLYYLKSLRLFNINSEITKIYEQFNEKIDISRWLYFYFTTAYTIMDENNEDLIKNQAKETYHRYGNQNDENLNIILYYILYGEENYKEAIQFSEEAAKLFQNNDFLNAANKYELAREKFPINPDYYYNGMASLFKSEKHKEAQQIFFSMPDSLNPKNGRFEFLVARSYLNLKDTLNSCIYFNKSNQLGMNSSLPYLKNLCNN